MSLIASVAVAVELFGVVVLHLVRDREEEVDQLRGGVVGEVERDGDVHNCTHRKDVGLRCAAESPRILGVPVPSGPGGNGRWSSGETLEVTVTFTERRRS